MEELKWWGYTHQNGTLQGPKRYFDPRDLGDAYESPFVMNIFGPFEAASSEEAYGKLRELAGR